MNKMVFWFAVKWGSIALLYLAAALALLGISIKLGWI